MKGRLKAAKLNNARLEASLIAPTDSSLVCYYPDLTAEEMREIVNSAKEKVGKILVVLTGNEGAYKYIMTSLSVDLSGIFKGINSDLSGRGGGRDNMIQGSFASNLDVIKDYFAKL